MRRRNSEGNLAVQGQAKLSCAKGVRLIFVGDRPAFVMLSEAKHLGNEGNHRLFSRSAHILRYRSVPALSAAEGMTE